MNESFCLFFYIFLVFSEHVYDKYFMPSLEYLSFERLRLSARKAGFTILGKSCCPT